MTRQVLITGGAGFVGSSLGLGLAQRYPDWKITALDNLKRRGSELNIRLFGLSYATDRVIRDETLIETDITAIFVNCLRSGAN